MVKERGCWGREVDGGKRLVGERGWWRIEVGGGKRLVGEDPQATLGGQGND